jgi:hypothetical protein
MNQSPQDTSGTAMAIQGLVQSVDLVTDALERKWGVGRLRLLVGDGLRERFDRQWAKWQAAYAAQDLEAVRAHSEAMRRAWAALEQAGERDDRDQVRAFVVGSTATVDFAITHHGLEGRGGPEIQRVGRLYVIVAVEDDVGPFLRAAATAEHDRVERRRDDFDLEAGLLEQSADMFARAIHARLEGGVGGHARVLHIID